MSYETDVRFLFKNIFFLCDFVDAQKPKVARVKKLMYASIFLTRATLGFCAYIVKCEVPLWSTPHIQHECTTVKYAPHS